MDDSPQQIGPLDPGELHASPSDERVARNEAAARRINETIEDGRLTRDALTSFVCECGQLGCNAIVQLTLGEYEEVRAEPRQFFVLDGHVPDVDTVVDRRSRYAIVAKQGLAGRIAETTDPRAGAR